ncbi:uncharacterized protein [Parasteatoda tepidariorum]|uniref:uncharacterized protein n=1 Tax=Parasteatoda tepidariorum TaxID=114398 RepID=UPI0039BCBD4A
MSVPIRVRVAEGLKKTTVEPFLFFIMFGYNVRIVTIQSLFHDRACRISLNYSNHICDNLDSVDNDYEQINAVTLGNNYYNAFVMISTIPALVMATFLGESPFHSHRMCSNIQPIREAASKRLQVHMYFQAGSLAIAFPYTRRLFKWDVPRYSYTTTFFSLLNAVATLTLVPILNKRLLVHEAGVGLIGILSLMAKMILMSLTMSESIIFYAWFAGTMYACGGIAVRSRMSKLVSKQELGKVFSLLATCESLTPVLGTISMTQIYNSSVHFYPGLAYASAAIFLIPATIIFAWMTSLSYIQYQESETAKKSKELKEVVHFNQTKY